MAIEPTDLLVVNRGGVDYKSTVDSILALDGAIVIKSGDGLSSTGVNDFSANQEDDRELILSVKVKDGIIIDGDGNIIIDPDFNFATEEHGIGDGAIAFNAGAGLEEVGDNATANQLGDTLKTFNVKTGGGIIIDGNNNIIIDPDFELSTEEHGIGDGAIAFNAGDGLAEVGDNATANQLGDTVKTFSVKTGGGIIIDGGGNVIIDPNFNLDGNITDPGDGAINVDAGAGLEATGTNATANQTGDTTRTLSVKTGDGITIDGSGNIIIDPNFNLDGNITDPGDGAIAFNAGDGLAETGTNATANQTADTTKTFSVKTGSGIIIDGGGNVIIDPNFNLDGNITDPGDGAINIDAGLGLEASGDNATANQTGNTTRTLSAKTGDGITIDGSGSIIIDPSFNLDGNITPPGDGKITINAYDGSEVGTFTVNQDAPTIITLPEVKIPESLHPSGFIDVSQPAPADPEHGDIYIQHRNDLSDVVADASFTGIAGRTVKEAQFVMFGVDDLWHAGGDAMPTDVQSDWAETDALDAAFIKNKPDLQSEVDTHAGDGAINVTAGPGLEATGTNATANQKTDTTRTLSVKTGDGIIIDSNGNVIIDPSFNLDGNVNLPTVNDGTLTIKDSGGTTVGTFTANQAGNTDVTLPKGFSGDYGDLNNVPTEFPPSTHTHSYNDLTDKPDINNGKLTIKDSGGNAVGEFTANQAGNTDVSLPKGFSGSWNDLTDKPSKFPPEAHEHPYMPLDIRTLQELS